MTSHDQQELQAQRLFEHDEYTWPFLIIENNMILKFVLSTFV